MATIQFERTFSVSQQKLFDFVSRSEHLLKWWGPEGVRIEDGDLNFAEPGPWASTMVNDNGGRFKVTGEVILVDAPKSIEFTWAWHNEDDDRGPESLVRFEVSGHGKNGAMLTLTHSKLSDEDAAKNHHEGWTSSLRKLTAMGE